MIRNILYALAASLALFHVQTLAQNQKNPYQYSDASWITLDGTVVSADANSFLLDYGDGIILVEMDDWDRYQEGSLISPGYKVSVTGLIDADLMERHTIEASAVYVEDLKTYYYASSADEEDLEADAVPPYALRPLGDESRLRLTGTVARINGRKFTLDTGATEIRVDTSTMNYNPLDNLGLQRISPGDKVSVNGRLDLDFFEGRREVDADSILGLERDSGKSKAVREKEDRRD